MKRCLGIALSILFLISCFSVGFTAFAASAAETFAAVDAFDVEALTPADVFSALTDAGSYPETAMAALDALIADYGALSQEELNAMPPETYLRLVDILYQAKLWSDWDAAGRPTDFYGAFMLYLAWQDAAGNKNADAADRLGRVPELDKNPTVKAFLDLPETAAAPYTNADIAAAKAAYAAISARVWTLLREKYPDRVEAATETYRTILASVGPDAQSDNAVDLSAYETAGPGEIKVSNKTFDRIVGLLAAAGLNPQGALAALPQKLAVGENVIGLLARIAALDPMISVFVSPVSVASALARDPKFSGAAEKLNALIAAGHTAFIETANGAASDVVWQADEDPAVTFTSADFGFEDGDLYGFIDALGAALGGTGGLLSLFGTFKNTKDTVNGEYRYGKYETLLPLLELLDLPVLSSVAFTEAEETVRFTDADGNEYADDVRAGVNALLRPVADYLTGPFADDPAAALAELLPKLAWAVESGLLQDTADSLLSALSSFGVAVDLSVDGVWGIVDEKLVSGENAGIDLNKDGKKEPLPLTRESFADLLHRLAHAAAAVVKPSVSAHNANRLGLDTSAGMTASAFAGWLAECLQTDAGKAFVEALFDGMQTSGVKAALLDRLQALLAEEGGLQKLIALIDSPLYVIAVCLLRFARVLDDLKRSFGLSRVC